MVTKWLIAQPALHPSSRQEEVVAEGQKEHIPVKSSPFLKSGYTSFARIISYNNSLASRKDGKCSFCQVGTWPSSTKLRFCSCGRGEWYCIGSQKFLPHLPCLPQNEILIYIVIIVYTLNKKRYRISEHLFYCLTFFLLLLFHIC